MIETTSQEGTASAEAGSAHQPESAGRGHAERRLPDDGPRIPAEDPSVAVLARSQAQRERRRRHAQDDRTQKSGARRGGAAPHRRPRREEQGAPRGGRHHRRLGERRGEPEDEEEGQDRGAGAVERVDQGDGDAREQDEPADRGRAAVEGGGQVAEEGAASEAEEATDVFVQQHHERPQGRTDRVAEEDASGVVGLQGEEGDPEERRQPVQGVGHGQAARAARLHRNRIREDGVVQRKAGDARVLERPAVADFRRISSVVEEVDGQWVSEEAQGDEGLQQAPHERDEQNQAGNAPGGRSGLTLPGPPTRREGGHAQGEEGKRVGEAVQSDDPPREEERALESKAESEALPQEEGDVPPVQSDGPAQEDAGQADGEQDESPEDGDALRSDAVGEGSHQEGSRQEQAERPRGALEEGAQPSGV